MIFIGFRIVTANLKLTFGCLATKAILLYYTPFAKYGLRHLILIQTFGGSNPSGGAKYGVSSVVAAQLSVKQLDRVRFPLSPQTIYAAVTQWIRVLRYERRSREFESLRWRQLCSYSLMEEHCLGMTDIAVRFCVRAPILMRG